MQGGAWHDRLQRFRSGWVNEIDKLSGLPSLPAPTDDAGRGQAPSDTTRTPAHPARHSLGYVLVSWPHTGAYSAVQKHAPAAQSRLSQTFHVMPLQQAQLTTRLRELSRPLMC